MASYTVKQGDTLSAIAKKYGTTYQEIAKANGISDPNKIYAGQTLNIGGNDSPSTSQPTGDASANTETKAPSFEYEAYKPSDVVTQAEALLQQQLANKPGEYTSAWQTQLNDTLNKILNREKFSYDLNGDALYQQYKDQYTTQGKMARMDTMGQAQAMTGGYGNTYAQSVGQQAYQGYLQQLNDRIPELYQLALNQYNAEGDEMYKQASLMAGMEEQDYGRYRDAVGDYYTELDRLTDDARYQGELDYGKWGDGRDFTYQQERDKIADAQWQAQFDEAKRQYDQQYALSQSKAYSGDYSNGGDTGDEGSTYDNGGVGTTAIKKMQGLLGVTADGKWGDESRAAAKKKYGIEDPAALYKKLVGSAFAADGKSADPAERAAQATAFTGSTYSEAAAYLKKNGYPTSGLMTSSEWARHKNGNNSAGGEHEASSYQEYLAAYIYGMKKK